MTYYRAHIIYDPFWRQRVTQYEGEHELKICGLCKNDTIRIVKPLGEVIEIPATSHCEDIKLPGFEWEIYAFEDIDALLLFYGFCDRHTYAKCGCFYDGKYELEKVPVINNRVLSTAYLAYEGRKGSLLYAGPQGKWIITPAVYSEAVLPKYTEATVYKYNRATGTCEIGETYVLPPISYVVGRGDELRCRLIPNWVWYEIKVYDSRGALVGAHKVFSGRTVCVTSLDRSREFLSQIPLLCEENIWGPVM